MTVPQVVKPDPAESRLPGEGDEPAADRVRVQRRPVLAGEHEPGVLPRGAEPVPFRVLQQSVREQGAGGRLVQLHYPVLPGGCLGPPHEGLSAELHDLLPHTQNLAFEVDVDPAQAAHLPAAKPRPDHDLEQGPEAVSSGGVEEPAELVGLPRVHGGTVSFRQLDVHGWVVREAPLLHRRVQRGAEGGMDPARGLRASASGEDVVDEPGHVLRAELVQGYRAEDGDQVQAQVRGVGVPGGRTQAALAGQPRLEELPGRLPIRCAHPPAEPFPQPVQRRECVRLAGETAAPVGRGLPGQPDLQVPRSVLAVGGQLGAGRAELLAVLPSARATAEHRPGSGHDLTALRCRDEREH
ncbi:MAG TPA: hypothetical protein VMI11_14075 [Actinomycetes bacterium]|nr:hypothetical protein [Actinomycetes bacterium]